MDIITMTMFNIMAIDIDFINKSYFIAIITVNTAFGLHLHLKFKINQKHFNLFYLSSIENYLYYSYESLQVYF